MPCCQSPSLPTGVEVTILMIIPPGGANSEGGGLPSCECDGQGDLRPEAQPLGASSLYWMNPGMASWLDPADVIRELGLMLAGNLRRVAPCCSRGQKNPQLGLKKGNMNKENWPEDMEKRDTGCLSHLSTSHCWPSLKSLE